MAEHLKKRRRELGLAQVQAAERIGRHFTTYRNRERGRTGPPTPEFKRVTTFLGYDPTQSH